jgi:ketosteroid isomerase-like protein
MQVGNVGLQDSIPVIILVCLPVTSGRYWDRSQVSRTTEVRPVPAKTIAQADTETLQQLNRDYIRSVQASDVRRFDEILAEDFLCSNPDGSLVDRAAFLAQTAPPMALSGLEAHDVRVWLIGDVAIIDARTTYMLADGRSGSGRYPDLWARRRGRWLAVSAHVTRC